MLSHGIKHDANQEPRSGDILKRNIIQAVNRSYVFILYTCVLKLVSRMFAKGIELWAKGDLQLSK